MRVLTVNAGSSSLKLALIDEHDRAIETRELDAPGARVDPEQLQKALSSRLGEADAVGHRIVHGGGRFREAVRVDAEVESQLRELTDLAPLHQPKSLAALDAVSEALPEIPRVACFDTAFHATLPDAAYTYALPAEWRERWGLRRYGFHGLSHSWIARRAPQLLERDPKRLRIVSCHLGAGASLCAIGGGISLDTTMGFTPLEGLVMATRSGSLDPGMLLWLMEHEQLEPEQLNDALEHRSGLLALAASADMAEIVKRRSSGDADAKLAFAVYIHRLRGAIAAMSAALGGLDVLVFTGGVGQHAPVVRSEAAAQLGFLGISLDASRNESAQGDQDISAEQGQVRTLLIGAREDLEIARQSRELLTR